MTNYFAILPVVSAVLSIALGLFTLSRNPRHITNIGFALGMASLAVIEAGNTVILLSSGGVGVRMLLIGESALPAAWILFSLAFARANYRDVLSKNTIPLAGVIAASLFFMIAWAAADIGPPHPVVDAYSGEPLLIVAKPLLKYFYIYLILGLVFNLVHLENTLRHSEGPKRWQIKYVIFGVGSIMAFFIFISSQALLYSTLTLGAVPVTSSVIIIAVFMMAVFIVRHRLMDVDIFISRYVVYNSLTVMIVGLYLIATGLIANGIRYFNVPFHYFFTTLFVFVAVLALFVMLFTASLRRKAQVYINRHFYKHKYEFRDKWMETVEKISPKRSVEEISKTLTEMVSGTMGVKEIYVWVYEPASGEYYSPAPGIEDGLRKIKGTHPLIALIRERMSPFTFDGAEGGPGPALDNEVEALVSSTRAALCAPLLSGHDIVGFLLQGADFSGEPYRRDDFEILKAMTTQAAVQITNIRLLEDLVNVKEVEAFSNMSSFIMHDLKNLTNSLSLVSQNARHNMDDPEFQQDAINTINSIVKRMKDVIEKLSSVPKGLDIRKAPVDLKGLIHNSIQKMPVSRSKNVIIVNEVETMPPVVIDPDAMEMVFLNILTNAYEAVRDEGRITVRGRMEDGYVAVTISDNGNGIPREFMETSLFKPFKTTKKSGLGIGLFQCKTVVEAHSGKIEIESAEGNGTSFKVILPASGRLTGDLRDGRTAL